jgi:hypothetical protein
VQYEFVRDAHDGTRILLHASAGPCPDRPVVYDLVVDPEQFGGREQLVERIVAELEGPGETALSRIIDRYLGLYQHCAQDGGVVAPDTTIRICDVRAPDVPLGAVIFRYLPEPIALLRPDGSSTLSRYARRDHPSLEELRQSEGAQARIAERVRWFEEQAPLSELEGGSYLGALIAGDWEVVTELDRRSFARLAARLDDETLTGLIALLALIQNRPSAAPWYRQIVLEYVAGSSLVSHLAATYLQEYAERYPADCLGSDPPRVVVTRRTQRYLDDGSGAPVPVGPAEEQRSEFAIKPELYDLLAQVAAARPQLAASLDALWVRVEGSLTPRQLSVGVRQLMARFPCDAPEILAFERHLRHLFELDRERTEQLYGELGLR